MSRPTDPRVTGLQSVLAHCPEAKVKYVNVVHVGFIWSGVVRSQMLNCNPPAWESPSRQETVCFGSQQTGINHSNDASVANVLLLRLAHTTLRFILRCVISSWYLHYLLCRICCTVSETINICNKLFCVFSSLYMTHVFWLWVFGKLI